jgi:hypothetical protein
VLGWERCSSRKRSVSRRSSLHRDHGAGWVRRRVILTFNDPVTGSATREGVQQKPFFIAWAGLRGADSLVIALALPFTIHGGAPFPSRDLIIFVTIGVIFMTLVVQGFSLAPLVRKLGLKSDGAEAKEERSARVAMANAALERLEEIEREGKMPANVIAKMRLEYEHRRRMAKRTHLPQESNGFDSAALRALRRRMQAAERAELLRQTEAGEIGGDVMSHLQRQQDLRDLLLTYDEEAGNDSHEHLAPGDDYTAEREEVESEAPQ